MMAKHDEVSDEDRALFRRTVGKVRMLDNDRVPPVRPAPEPITRIRNRIRNRIGDRTRPNTTTPWGLVESEWIADIAPGDVLSFATPGVQPHTIVNLRNGQNAIEADLDLHGRTVADAVTALARFLEDCRLRRWSCVRVIHGKGSGSKRGPVIKAHLNRWLRHRVEVLAFCSATPADGGTGALYILLES